MTQPFVGCSALARSSLRAQPLDDGRYVGDEHTPSHVVTQDDGYALGGRVCVLG